MDIVVTIPKSEYTNDDRETEVFKRGGYEQFWQLTRKPKDLQIGDRVYFVKHNRIESSMRVTKIKQAATEKCDVTNRTWCGCLIYLDDLQYTNATNNKNDGLPEAVKGFQGFRYRWW